MIGAYLNVLILDGRARTGDRRPFRWSRYAENDSIPGAHAHRLAAGFGHSI